MILIDWGAIFLYQNPNKKIHCKVRRQKEIDTCNCSLSTAELQTQSVDPVPLTLLEAHNALCLTVLFVLLWLCKKRRKTDTSQHARELSAESDSNSLILPPLYVDLSHPDTCVLSKASKSELHVPFSP